MAANEILRAFPATFELGDGRTVIGRCVPYGVSATVADPPEFVPYLERFAPGAFRKAAQAGGHWIELRHEHGEGILDRIGRARSLRDEPDGLYGEFEVLPGEPGNQALELVRAGILSGMSISAKVDRSQTLEDGTVERIKATLRHVGLTSTPAYAGAEVLAMRTASSSATARIRAETDRLRLRSPAS